MASRLAAFVGAGLLAVLIVAGILRAERSPQAVAGSPAPAPAAPIDPNAPHVELFRDPKTAPAFAVTAFDGRAYSLASLAGKVVIVNFWATWCGPCRAEIPSFVDLQRKYAAQFVILGLSADETGEAGVRAFAAKLHVNYPVAMASDAVQSAFGGIPSLPTSFVLDQAGRVVEKHVGLIDPSVYELEVRALAHLPINAVVDQIDDPTVAATKPVTTDQIPGVDLSHLTPAEKTEALAKMNATKCTCGCGRTVARCRIEDSTCDESLAAAQKIVDDIVARDRGGKRSGKP